MMYIKYGELTAAAAHTRTHTPVHMLHMNLHIDTHKGCHMTVGWGEKMKQRSS